jgi:hypothetical protein
MSKLNLSFPLIAVILGLAVVPASSQTGKKRFMASLLGINEVASGVGAVSTAATGSFRATLSDDGTTISYRLQYADLEGDITQSHIHVGQTHTAGGISVWLCQTAGTPAPAAVIDITPLCGDPRSDTVEGTFTAANVIGPSGSGIDANEFAELIQLMRSRVTYANVHTSKFGPGEIRGQIR